MKKESFFHMRRLCHRVVVVIGMFVAVVGTNATGMSAASEISGKFHMCFPREAITSPPGTHPMFSYWHIGYRPIECIVDGPPNATLQVFIGLNECFWDHAGQRLLDIEIDGKIVASGVDTFQSAMGTPSGHVFRAKLSDNGRLIIKITANANSPDKTPVVCGILLFGECEKLDVANIISNNGPKPLASILVEPPDEQMDLMMKSRGLFFPKRKYEPQPLPIFEETRHRLPQPIYDENPDYVKCYWKAWELAFASFRQPEPGSPFVSNYIDDAFGPSLFLWDTAFMTMYCNYAHPYVPGIQSIDNFYCVQLPDGEMVREVKEATGIPAPESKAGTSDSLNHPILAWAEREAYRITGDRERLKIVYEPLVRYYRSFDKILDQSSGFYEGTWASMDNSPRLDDRKMLCSIDTTSEMVIFARDLAYIAEQLGRHTDAERFEVEAAALSKKINEKLWDEKTQFYYDWNYDGQRQSVKTIAGFWPLLGKIASPEHVKGLIAHLENPAEFNRVHRVPTVPADEPTFDPNGGYWRGAVWTMTNTMVIRGLERNGYESLAAEIARNHLKNVVEIYSQSGTIYENFAPDSVGPGRVGTITVGGDLVGWGAIPPVVYLIEHAIGIKVDAISNTIHWNIRSNSRVGVEKLWFGGKTVSLVCEAPNKNGVRKIRVETDQPFHLVIEGNGKSLTQEIFPDSPMVLEWKVFDSP